MPYFSVHKFYYHWTLSIRFPLPIYLNCIYCLVTFAISFLTCLMIVVMARFSSLLPISTPIEYRLFEISASFPKCPLSKSEIQDIHLEYTDRANELGSLLPHLNINMNIMAITTPIVAVLELNHLLFFILLYHIHM